MCHPRNTDRAPESELDRYLDEARARFAAAPGGGRADGTFAEDGAGMTADFEHLRWFDLPAVCLAGAASARIG
jgi:hypothetical protein